MSVLSAGSGARRRALVVLNCGIGNRVMSAPLFAHLGDKVDFALTGSPMPASLLRNADPGTAALPYELPPLWRRFRPEDHGAILSFLTRKDLDLLINLRKEDPALDGGYFNLREMATAAGIECWDLHELGPECHAVPFVRQCLMLFARHLGPLPAPSQQWLAHIRRAPAEPSIGVFLGASVPVKRAYLTNIIFCSIRSRLCAMSVSLRTMPDSEREQREAGIAARWADASPHMDERTQRVWLGPRRRRWAMEG